MFKNFLTRGDAKVKRDPLRKGILRPFQSKALLKPGGIKRIELDYEVYPRPRSLRSSAGGERLVARLQACAPAALGLVQETARFKPEFQRISVGPQPRGIEPNWVNGWFPGFDAVMLYGLLALRNPRRYVEVGSGNSTRFARRAIRDHGLRTQIISIDPCPRAEIDAICDHVMRAPLEDVNVQEATKLTCEDLLFVDSSHRSFQNSDVTVFFTEILPGLPPGLVYGLHDIFLPQDYPLEWSNRFYSEQYLLASYLAGGADGDEVLLPVSYLSSETRALEELAPIFDPLGLAPEQRAGSSFWMRKAPR